MASVLAFDVTRRLYTSAAINAVNALFPNRTVSLVTGDSTLSIPNFARAHSSGPNSSGLKYNLIFIDGGHSYDVALADIVNTRALANHTYHLLAIDDGSSPEVRSAWDYAEHTLKIVRLLKIQPVPFDECVNVASISTGILAGSFQTIPCTGSKTTDGFDDIIIGEYVW